MLPTTGSRITPAIWSPCGLEQRRPAASTSLYRRTSVSARAAGRHAGAVRHAERQGARPGRDEQRIDVAVVAAGELDDQVAAGEPAGQADRRSSSLRSRSRRTGPSRPTAPPRRPARRVRFRARVGAPKLDPSSDRRDRRLDHGRVGVAEDHRPPRPDEVEVAVAVDVEEVRPLAAGDERAGCRRPPRTPGPGCSPRRG